jgi:uncharacterized protein YbjT (DUF2867 family)
MTILVTGGTGLVGSRLLARFAKDGIECRALIRAGKQGPPEPCASKAISSTPNP